MKRAIVFLAVLVFTGCQTAPAVPTTMPTLTAAPATTVPSATNIPSPTPRPTMTMTPPPSPTTDPCIPWDQVTVDMKGQTVCVHGIISKFTQSRQVGSRYQFGEQAQGFFLYSKYWEIYNSTTGKTLGPGTCVQVTSTIQVQSGIPFINIDEIAAKVPGKEIGGFYSYSDTSRCE